MKKVFLSHFLNESTPGFGGSSGFAREAKSRICDGHSSNSDKWVLSNHIGTHVDCPKHFAEAGATLDSFPAEFWDCAAPQCLDLPQVPGAIISTGDWTQQISPAADFLILRTGFEKVRLDRTYWENNPGVDPKLGEWLREFRPKIKFFGFDFISLTAYQKRELGRAAHRAFLDPNLPGSPILIVEDMHLAHLQNKLIQATISPLLVTGADGAPVTISAEVE